MVHRSSSVPYSDIARAACRRSIMRRGSASLSSSRARRKSLHLPPLCVTRLGTIVEGRARSLQCLEQVLDQRAGSPVGWQAIRARCGLSDAAEPHLSRRDRSEETIVSLRALADHRSVALGCGSGLACRQRRPAQPQMTKELRRLPFREGSWCASDREAVQRTLR